MSEATTRAAIKTLLEGVSNIGLVYDLEPFADNWNVFIDRFKTTVSSVSMIRGWTISCEAIGRTGLTAGGARNLNNTNEYQYRIRGYQSFDYETSTEKTFMTLTIAVMDALDSGITGTGNVINANLAQLTSYAPRVFGGVLCHVAEIEQVVRETI